MTDPLPAESLRWRCDPESLPFETTQSVEPIAGVIGQPAAVEALRFGIECHAPGQNVFVRGLSGAGRLTLVAQLLRDLRPACEQQLDRCYVHNFAHASAPRLVSLPPGTVRTFRRLLGDLASFIEDDLAGALTDEQVATRKDTLERRTSEEIDEFTKPFEDAIKEAGLALVTIRVGPVTRPAIFAVVEGRSIPPEEFDELVRGGQITDEQVKEHEEKASQFGRQLENVVARVTDMRLRGARKVSELLEGVARDLLGEMTRPIQEEFPGDDIAQFLDEIVDDVIESRIRGDGPHEPASRRYGVNVLFEHKPNGSCPVVLENTPNLSNLLGTIQREWTPQGIALADYRSIRGGSLLRADGGYLVLDARDVLEEPGAWKVLVRTLRQGTLEIVPSELGNAVFQPAIKPEPIPIRVRVILIGNAQIYHLLDAADPDFSQYFKVLADFDRTIDNDTAGVLQYAGVLARAAKEEGLPAFDRAAVAALAEHGARVASHRQKLTTRFGRVMDLAREAAYVAGRSSDTTVTATHVDEAVRRTKSRADLPSRRFMDFVETDTIHIRVEGAVVGQINGLAVTQAGPLSYGIPARITATVGAGSMGVIDIEEQSALSGAIHTKGFHILGGLLRALLPTSHPLSFSASLAFEQSYGGIDGDSASTAEICCLLSALSGTPIRQDLAITGAIDQHGRVQAIGGATEKIEGFFDCCKALGLTGTQGVVIPRSNAADLMLRAEVVDACAAGQFHVYAVGRVSEALELLTGVPAGTLDEDGQYGEETILGRAMERAAEYWLKSNRSPSDFVRAVTQTEPDSDAA